MLRKFSPVHAVFILATLTIAAIAVSLSFLLWDLRARELDHARMETEGLARMFMEQTEQNFDTADLVLRGIQERMQSNFGRQLAIDGLPVRLLLSSRVHGLRHLRSLFVVDAKGMVVNTSRPEGLTPLSVADRDYFLAFSGNSDNRLFVSHPVRNKSFGVWTLYLARPLTSDSGKLQGVLVAAIDVQQFEQLYSFLQLDLERLIAIYLRDGTLVASVPHREELVGTRPTDLGLETIGTAGIHTSAGRDADGSPQTLSVGLLQRYPLAISVRNDDSVALASWRETALPITLGAVLVSGFIAVVAAALARELRREESLSRALSEAEDLHHHTIESVMDAIIVIDASHRIVLFNPAAERMFGYSAAEVRHQPLSQLLPERLRQRHHAHVTGFLNGPVASGNMGRQLEIVGRRADGTEFPIESTISKTAIGGKLQTTAVLRDVSEHRLAEANLRAVNRQLRELYAAMQTVREDERTRIARELHDDLGQQLTGLKLDLSWLGGRLKDGRAPAPEKVDDMRRLLDTAIASVRRISSDLRPLILDDLGFAEAVSWQAQEMAERGGLKLSLKMPAADLVQGGNLSTGLFRIVQESLTNVLRHSGATAIDIALVSDSAHLRLSISDNGTGFDEQVRPGGIGLLNMRERAMALGGQFAIVSAPGAGTTIQVSIPLQLVPGSHKEKA